MSCQVGDPMPEGKDRQRPVEEMVDALRGHTRLLREYAQKLSEGDTTYGGEIAGKLRLLVTRSRANTPLLLLLMRETGLELKLTMGGPPIPLEPGGPILAGQQIPLAEYIALPAIGVRVPSGTFEILSKEKLIRAWAEQTGASHEDWAMDETLSSILSMGVFIGGLPGAFAELSITARAVLGIAEQFLEEYHSRLGSP
jgi:hypothetical protein